VSQKAAWRRFVERRRRELHADFPCAAETARKLCPKHRIPVPQTAQLPEGFVQRSDGSWRHVEAQTLQLSGICRACRTGLFEQLAAEYRQHDAARRAAINPKGEAA
jgi:hypothetical protein